MKKTLTKMLVILVVLCIALANNLVSIFAESSQPLRPTGWIPTPSEKYNSLPQATRIYSSSTSLAQSVDLTSMFPQPGDQGQLGSCVAWATGYAYKSFQERNDMKWDLNQNAHLMSPAFIYNQIHVNQSADGGGAYFEDAFNLLNNKGCVTLDMMPYNPNAYGYTTVPTADMFTKAADFKALSWGVLPRGNYNEIKAHLAGGDAVVIGIDVYPDFDLISTLNPIYDTLTGVFRGRHAICLIGYDDAKNAFKFINSWGSSWGLNGYGWISYNVVSDLYTEAFVMTDAKSPKNVAIKTSTTPGKYFCAENGGGQGIIVNRDYAGSWETFRLINQGGNKYALQANNGQYLCAENGGGGAVVANRNSVGSWETFTLIDLGNNQIALQAYNGQYLCADGGGGGALIANRNFIGSWETFIITYIN